MKLQFSQESVEDLERLRAFIEQNYPEAAQRIANELLLGMEKLKIYPEIGLEVDRAFDSKRIRDLFVDKYTVRYLIGDGEIVILRVWHGKEIGKNL